MSSSIAALKIVRFDSLDTETQELLKEAVQARERAYAPYSKFKVGACLLCEDGSKFKGCNVENSASGAICAERTAYVKAVSEGNLKFKAIAVTAYQEKYITTPCGACRQFMSEFGNVIVYMTKPDLKEVFVSTLDELMPYQFQHNSDFTF
ncbi:hypothetical protein ILUMI_25568 [Ignelater luminosus]|uniref:Cytidine deaminase n=1 Tax=Ignelater luminosus TaxID=2038154 RepID=A0A8K0FZX7_IGNLU|nr:hypothetical protein ILUMI_25568 [Ignelater luminosus]